MGPMVQVLTSIQTSRSVGSAPPPPNTKRHGPINVVEIEGVQNKKQKTKLGAARGGGVGRGGEGMSYLVLRRPTDKACRPRVAKCRSALFHELKLIHTWAQQGLFMSSYSLKAIFYFSWPFIILNKLFLVVPVSYSIYTSHPCVYGIV